MPTRSIVTEKSYWIAFSFFEGIGPIRFKHLLAHFGSAKKAWQAKNGQLIKTSLGTKLVEKFCQFRTEVNPEKAFALKENLFLVENYPFKKIIYQIDDPQRQEQLKWVLKYQQYQTQTEGRIAVITWQDKEYPKDLKNIPASPPVIYARGNLSLLGRSAIAVVGTRKISNYGIQVTEKLTTELASSGLVIISGMAMGVDSFAHRTALKTGGKTIAVLGCGVDRIYPAENRLLYQEIIKDNLVVSEFPPGTPPLPGNFPARNRIIVGLSKAVLVTEAAQKSGALISASCAAEQGKEVFAVPGPITSPASVGTSWLIKQGAKLVSSAEDIFEEMNLEPRQSTEISQRESQIENLSTQEKLVFEAVSEEPLSADDIIAKTGIGPAELGGLLTMMKVKGILKEFENGEWGKG